MKSILVTGGAGFIGSNLILKLVKECPDALIINLDNLTYASDLTHLKTIQGFKNYLFIEGDICNRELLTHLFRSYDIRNVLHLAAESHVDNSINSPEIFVKTNVMGTFNLLDVARNEWMSSPFKFLTGYENSKFIHVSTDEVYGSLGNTGYFTETTPYAPNSPYSASKASSDMMVRSYFHTYGMPVMITNCSNNYGPRQHNEKLIPTIIKNALESRTIPIYGDGKNVRDWLFVQDHCSALKTVFETGKEGETYNIGGNNEQTNIKIAKTICDILDNLVPITSDKHKSYSDLIQYVQDRPGHDKRYAIDASKIKNELNWEPSINFEEGITQTIQWYLDQYITTN